MRARFSADGFLVTRIDIWPYSFSRMAQPNEAFGYQSDKPEEALSDIHK
ncbi:MAG: hypothetical protein ACK4NW_04370 [Roseinatronobacter sp.]